MGSPRQRCGLQKRTSNTEQRSICRPGLPPEEDKPTRRTPTARQTHRAPHNQHTRRRCNRRDRCLRHQHTLGAARLRPYRVRVARIDFDFVAAVVPARVAGLESPAHTKRAQVGLGCCVGRRGKPRRSDRMRRAGRIAVRVGARSPPGDAAHGARNGPTHISPGGTGLLHVAGLGVRQLAAALSGGACSAASSELPYSSDGAGASSRVKGASSRAAGETGEAEGAANLAHSTAALAPGSLAC